MPSADSLPWYLEPGVLLLVATKDLQGRPRISRGVAARRSDDGQQLIVFISMPEGLESLDHISANGTIAVVFARPTDYRSVQLKGSNAHIVPATGEDNAVVRRAYDGAIALCHSVGVSTAVLERLLSPEGTVAVAFTPDGGWDQTPGRDAGREVPL